LFIHCNAQFLSGLLYSTGNITGFLLENSSRGSSEFGMTAAETASWDLTNKKNIFGLEKVQKPAK
jgi:hypothetical protein